MDGVISDWNSGFVKLTGMTEEAYSKHNPKKDYRELIINQKGANFYEELNLLPDADKLINYIRKNFKYIHILSSTGARKNDKFHSIVSNGKIKWIKRNLPWFDLKRVILVRDWREKNMFCVPDRSGLLLGSLLIDDKEETIKNWIETGGHGILHKDVNSTVHQLKNL